MSDTISRQAVLRLLYSLPPEEAMTKALLTQSVQQMDAAQSEITLESAIDYLHSIGWMQEHDRILTESAQPERKKGEWIDYANSHCECSVCHTEWSYFQNEVECFEFCPNCGADMREVSE